MQNYNKIQKILHDFVLSKKFISKSLFEIEKIYYLNDIKIKNQSHVFITGLPRSGTTSLLNFLYLSNEYASLTYKNMPFVLSPNLSKLFYRKKNLNKKERLHGDGIKYDLNSPEALDEIFFNLDTKFVNSELLNYLQLVCISQKKNKYLSKNNLNYKRINLIKSILPNSTFLIPIREPLQHTHSLYCQHLKFCKFQKDDDFIRRYMNYLGHNEFGLNHQSWNSPLKNNDIYKLDYWLEQWCLFYENILNEFKHNQSCYFIIYEKLINSSYIIELLNKINFGKIEGDINLNYFKNSNKNYIREKYSISLYNKALKIYKEFKYFSF